MGEWKIRHVVLALCLALHGGAAWAAGEAATMGKADALRAEPYLDAKSIKTLAAGETLQIVGRQGGWYRVKAGTVQGWVRMLSVRKGSTQKGSAATGLLALAAGRGATGKVVATTGVRGLNEEELKAAVFDEAEVARAEDYAVNRADAEKFARQGKLKPRAFDYLSAK
ncbi:MAG: hypothetical protein Fur0040_10600 [Sideroxydans sp.]